MVASIPPIKQTLEVFVYAIFISHSYLLLFKSGEFYAESTGITDLFSLDFTPHRVTQRILYRIHKFHTYISLNGDYHIGILLLLVHKKFIPRGGAHSFKLCLHEKSLNTVNLIFLILFQPH
jgi:hypothetical protein